jgi:hypothetical protein
MCSCAEWESLVRRLEEAIEDGRARDVVSDAAGRIDVLIDEIMGWARAPEQAEWVRGPGRRSRPEWVV